MTFTGRTIFSLVLLILAIVCFVFAAFNWTPQSWTVNLTPLGLALFAASFLPGVWVVRTTP